MSFPVLLVWCWSFVVVTAWPALNVTDGIWAAENVLFNQAQDWLWYSHIHTNVSVRLSYQVLFFHTQCLLSPFMQAVWQLALSGTLNSSGVKSCPRRPPVPVAEFITDMCSQLDIGSRSTNCLTNVPHIFRTMFQHVLHPQPPHPTSSYSFPVCMCVFFRQEVTSSLFLFPPSGSCSYPQCVSLLFTEQLWLSSYLAADL